MMQCEKDVTGCLGFKDGGREPQAKECGHPLEDRKGKEMDPSGVCPRFHFSPVRPMLDF